MQRITIPEIQNHSWFLKNLPIEFMEGGYETSTQSDDASNQSQSIDEVVKIIQEARIEGPKVGGYFFGEAMDLDDLDADADIDDIETSGDFVCAL